MFSIDDVRETLIKDVTRGLDQISAAAAGLGGAPDEGTRAFRSMGDASHAVRGTTALVGATSLASTAMILEQLAARGERDLAMSARYAERARRIAELVAAGAGEMKEMLELELAHRAQDAEWAAVEWQTRAAEVLETKIEDSAPSELLDGEVPAPSGEELASEPELPSVARSPNSDTRAIDTAWDADDADRDAFSFDEVTPVLLEIDDELRAIFLEEVRASTTELQTQFDALIVDHGDLVAVKALERVFHTLKGAAATVGAEQATEAAHALQLRMAPIVDGETQIDDDLLTDLVAHTQDLLGCAGLSDIALGVQHRAPEAANEAAFEPAVTGDRHDVPRPDPELWAAFSTECSELLETIDQLTLQLESTERPVDVIEKLLPVYHTLKGVVSTLGMVLTGEAVHRVEDLLEGLVTGGTLPPAQALTTLLLDVQRDLRRNLVEAEQGYVELSLAELERRIASVMGDVGASSIAVIEEASPPERRSGARDFVRVETDRLDRLMDLAGELVVRRSRLMSRVGTVRALHVELGQGSQRLVDRVEAFGDEHEFARLPVALASGVGSLRPRGEAWRDFSELEFDRYDDVQIFARELAELSSNFSALFTQMSDGLTLLAEDSDQFDGIVGGIQSEITRARMVPLDVVFTRLRVPIRDAAVREQKEVRVVTRGEDVQLDKAIADALLEPLLHLVRNAVAHAFSAAGAGVVTLSAREEFGQIVLEVGDDGVGLDLEKLKARGVAMGLVGREVPLEDPRIRDLVFARGLSTADVARSTAGRGLGCDIVKRAVERLGGSIRVETARDDGTRFVLTLPVTLAITRALLVRQGAVCYAVPLHFAERILDAREDVLESGGVRRVLLDGAFVPVSNLGAAMGQPPSSAVGPILVVRSGSERLLLQVDGVVGQEELVVKDLGVLLRGHPLFAGATIRGTGEMALILDVAGLVESRSLVAAPVPRALPPPPRTSRPAERRRSSLATTGEARIRVLFVDDSLSVRKVAEKAFASLGVEVVLAVDGLDALPKLQAGGFDMVFTDLEMPRMHGFELIRELRLIDLHKDLPIVVVTSRAGQKYRDEARALGATEYLTKPFTPRTLAEALERWRRGVSR